ncbi:PTS transporter subunit EIIC [Dielma fastidiosa]|uniref:PTS system beta-glucosides-specific IIC component n=1 Tax=Dielma fastidiosa TaxID=1034346 RepID=A0A318KNY7_9FIRM|nr:PTS transporter subunit EIIC [Dielma fastidiosa]PXX79531.1 PTS system beta-glucosides-specific IIC component [Dielma fastidiosa]
MKELAEKCIEFVGGASNIKAVSHCATRLRLTLIDQGQVNEEALLSVPEVIKVMKVGAQTQIIIGSDAPELYSVVSQLVETANSSMSVNETKSTDTQSNKKKKNAVVGKFFDACSSMFTPLVPAFTAAGMIKAVLAILVAVFGLAKTSQEYIIINYVSDTIFYFLPIYLGVTAATYFGCNKYIAAAIAAMFVHPTYTGMVSAGEAISFFGIPVVLYNYSSTVFPTILTVWFMSYVERFARRISPKVIKAIMEPMLTLLITFPVGLLLLGPIGAVLGDWLMNVFAAIDASVPFLVPMIVGAVSPFLVFVGMHRAVGTLETMQIAQIGYSSLLGTGMLASNIAQGASTLVLSFKSKDDKVKPLAFTAGVTALCGITEPALYGFTAKNKKSLIATVIGGGVGGFYAGITHVVRFAKGAPGLPTLPVFISLENPMNLINACITVILSFAVAFAVAWIMIKPGEVD